MGRSSVHSSVHGEIIDDYTANPTTEGQMAARDRVALWKAMQQLGRQLEEKQHEGPGEFARASRRAAFAIASLKLAGFTK